ncbi:MAG: hypothetical protein BWY78_00741 [Alphaproteobacteria bacterium ADurb.Bin438]|nr:MAG: hypothetical protein BWY78_00741 [Alphaproteobacteria bacterium ADurb.Bin438]
MKRFILILIIFLTFPTFLYIYKNAKEKNKEKLRNIPILPLFYIGFVLVVVLFGFFAMWERADVGKKYIPPRYEHGKLIEGRFE